MLRHMLRKSARVKIVKVPCHGADDNRDGFSLILGCLSVRSRDSSRVKKKRSSDGYDKQGFYLLKNCLGILIRPDFGSISVSPLNLPRLSSSSLHPPVLTRFNPKLVTLAVLFGK